MGSQQQLKSVAQGHKQLGILGHPVMRDASEEIAALGFKCGAVEDSRVQDLTGDAALQRLLRICNTDAKATEPGVIPTFKLELLAASIEDARFAGISGSRLKELCEHKQQLEDDLQRSVLASLSES